MCENETTNFSCRIRTEWNKLNLSQNRHSPPSRNFISCIKSFTGNLRCDIKGVSSGLCVIFAMKYFRTRCSCLCNSPCHQSRKKISSRGNIWRTKTQIRRRNLPAPQIQFLITFFLSFTHIFSLNFVLSTNFLYHQHPPECSSNV